MALDPVIYAAETFSLTAILVAFILFTRLAVKAKSVGSLRFQLSVFLLVWTISEIPHVAETLGFISLFSYDTIGLSLHALSMTLFAIFIGFRSYNFLKIRPPGFDTSKPLPSDLPGDFGH
jgi:hypothetical protein